MRLLHVVGIVFAIIGIIGAVNLFNATSDADFASAQDNRRMSNRVRHHLVFRHCHIIPA